MQMQCETNQNPGVVVLTVYNYILCSMPWLCEKVYPECICVHISVVELSQHTIHTMWPSTHLKRFRSLSISFSVCVYLSFSQFAVILQYLHTRAEERAAHIIQRTFISLSVHRNVCTMYLPIHRTPHAGYIVPPPKRLFCTTRLNRRLTSRATYTELCCFHNPTRSILPDITTGCSDAVLVHHTRRVHARRCNTQAKLHI